MSQNKNILSEYSNEESAFLKGALSSIESADEMPFSMTISSKEYELFDFSMYSSDTEEGGEEFFDLTPEDEEEGSFCSEEVLARLFSEAKKHPVSEEYRVTCSAFVKTDEDCRTVITYTESIDGETEQVSRISFDPAMPHLIMIHKSGMASTTLIIEQGVRHSCVYCTPFMDFEMRLHALKVENSFTAENGGRLLLDYALEIKGAVAHRTIMEITLKPED